MEENKEQNENSTYDIKFHLWFYIAFGVCALVFIIVSAITLKVFYWAAAAGFAVLFAEFLIMSIKTKNALLIAVSAISAAAFALTFTLAIMQACGMG